MVFKCQILINEDKIEKDILKISGDDFNHIKNVLRLKLEVINVE